MNFKTSKLTMKEKFERSCPYNLFYNVIPWLEETRQQPNAIEFHDLLCPSLGKVQESFHITNKYDPRWLKKQYQAQNVNAGKNVILYGAIPEEKNCYKTANKVSNNAEDFSHLHRYVKFWQQDLETAPSSNTFIHHQMDFANRGFSNGRLSLFRYKDVDNMLVLRVVVSCANLCPKDWNHFNQMIWVSPELKTRSYKRKLSTGVPGKLFRRRLKDFIESFKNVSQSEQCTKDISYWVNVVESVDFSPIKVFLLSTIPHTYPPYYVYCHQYLREFLGTHATIPGEKEEHKDWSIVIQTKSLCEFDLDTSWIKSMKKIFAAHYYRCACKGGKKASSAVPLKIIYPTEENTKKANGAWFPYDKEVYDWQVEKTALRKQNYLHQWKADGSIRSESLNSSSTYCRMSPDNTKISWFLLTSANFTRTGWGYTYYKKRGPKVKPSLKIHRIPKRRQRERLIRCNSYQLGVLLLPKFILGEDSQYFEVNSFPLMYDLPLTAWEDGEKPYLSIDYYADVNDTGRKRLARRLRTKAHKKMVKRLAKREKLKLCSQEALPSTSVNANENV